VTSPAGRADTEYLLDSAGPAAPPRDNGELTFGAPWQGQAFGLALALQESGQIDWEDFRQRLIAEISSWQAGPAAASEWSYYGCWLSALERMVSERGLVDGDDLRARAELLAARPRDHGPPGHQHVSDAIASSPPIEVVIAG
jgi:nitrile hydratase accessory protein